MDKIIIDSIQYGASYIEYTVSFFERKTLGIYVKPDGTVFLKAPIGSSLEQIQEKVHKRANWILRQRRFFESFGVPTTERQFVSGESHLYLGRQYMLRVKKSEVNDVHYQNNIIGGIGECEIRAPSECQINGKEARCNRKCARDEI